MAAMANLLPINSLSVRASAVSGHRRSDNIRRKTSISGDATNANASNAGWWSPLFGWSSNADYFDSKKKEDPTTSGLQSEKNPDPELKQAKPRFIPGCFTEEKAKQLRMKMAMESGAFHDVMYHSAIASRLASDFSRPRSGDL